MNCCSQPSVSESVINEDYPDFPSLNLPTLLAHRLSPPDDDSSTALCDSGVASQTTGGNYEEEDDDDDDEAPPVLDLYGRALPEPIQTIEEEAPSTPEDSADGPPVAIYEQKFDSMNPIKLPMVSFEDTAPDDINGKVRRSARQARQKKAKDYADGAEQFSRGDDCRVEVPDWSEPAISERESFSEDKDVCIWTNSETLDESELEELVDIARRQLGMNQEEVLEALYKNHYDLLETLERLEEYIGPRNEPFSKNEIRSFFQGMRACNNNDFVYIKTNYLPARKVTELVDFYYKTKKTKCFGQPTDRCCPFKIRLYNDEEPLVPRTECANCCGTVQNKNLDKDIPTLCGVCNFYYRKAKKLRPFYVPLASTDPGNNIPKTVDFKEEAAECSSLTTACLSSEKSEHGCSFVKNKLKKLRTARWTPHEKEKAVIAFFKFGKDFAAIANEIETKSATDVKRFYVNFGSDYRLDFLVNHSHGSQKVEKDAASEQKCVNSMPEEQQNIRRQTKKRRA